MAKKLAENTSVYVASLEDAGSGEDIAVPCLVLALRVEKLYVGDGYLAVEIPIMPHTVNVESGGVQIFLSDRFQARDFISKLKAAVAEYAHRMRVVSDADDDEL